MNAEIKCYEYINALRDIESLPNGLYKADKIREQIHDELCKLFKIDKETTKKYTDNLDLCDDKVAEKLYFDLLRESNHWRELWN